MTLTADELADVTADLVHIIACELAIDSAVEWPPLIVPCYEAAVGAYYTLIPTSERFERRQHGYRHEAAA